MDARWLGTDRPVDRYRPMRSLARLVLLAALSMAAACRPEPQPLAFTTSIDPVPPQTVHGTAHWGLSETGDLVLDVFVRGAADEISRQRGSRLEPNLIWHLVQGDCTAWIRSDRGLNVLSRFSPTPASPDSNDFRYTIKKADAGDPTRPRALVAFRNGGGGPLYACADLRAG